MGIDLTQDRRPELVTFEQVPKLANRCFIRNRCRTQIDLSKRSHRRDIVQQRMRGSAVIIITPGLLKLIRRS